MGRDFPHVQTGPGAHPVSCTIGTGSFPGVKYGRGMLLTTQPLLVLRSWESRAINLPTLWITTGPVTGTRYPYIGLERPVGLQEVEGPRISRQLAQEGGKVVSCTHRLPLPIRKYAWYSFLLEAETKPGP